jgi:hypothetical protein
MFHRARGLYSLPFEDSRPVILSMPPKRGLLADVHARQRQILVKNPLDLQTTKRAKYDAAQNLTCLTRGTGLTPNASDRQQALFLYSTASSPRWKLRYRSLEEICLGESVEKGDKIVLCETLITTLLRQWDYFSYVVSSLSTVN